MYDDIWSNTPKYSLHGLSIEAHQWTIIRWFLPPTPISYLSSLHITVMILLFPLPSSPQNHHSPDHQIASSSTFALREKREEMVAVTEVSLTPTPLLVKGSIMDFYHKYHQWFSKVLIVLTSKTFLGRRRWKAPVATGTTKPSSSHSTGKVKWQSWSCLCLWS